MKLTTIRTSENFSCKVKIWENLGKKTLILTPDNIENEVELTWVDILEILSIAKENEII